LLPVVAQFVLDLFVRPSVQRRIAATVAVSPLQAGRAYEVIKAASRNERSVVFRAVSLPGLALQKITTRPPTRDQIEVAIRAMEAVMAGEGLHEGPGEGSGRPAAGSPAVPPAESGA